MLKNRRGFILLLLIINLSILAVSLLYALLFHLYPEFFACSFKRIFSLYCPGCGGSRALTRLLSFDLVGSFLALPPLWFAIAAIVELDARILIAAIKNDSSPIKSYKPILFYVFAGALVLNFILRNILLVTVGFDPLGDLTAHISLPFILI